MDFIESLRLQENSQEEIFGSKFSLFDSSSPEYNFSPEFSQSPEIVNHSVSHHKAEPTPPDREEIIQRVEGTILKLVRDLVQNRSPVLRLRTTHWNNCTYDDDVVCLKPVSEAQMTEVRLDADRSRHKFTVIIYILGKIHSMLQSGSTCTRRELYYQNVPLLRTQSIVDHAVRDICCLLDAPCWSLGVNATSKGLVAGDLTITTSDGRQLVCSATGGVLLPQNIHGIQYLESHAKFVLVIEKDATFQKLLNDGAPDKFGPCVLITGKGFPDVNTRLMVKRLWQDLQIPIYALVDADPHGIEIMCSYRFGSLNRIQ